MKGLTLDTGALIALERRDKRMRTRLEAAYRSLTPVTVPAVVVIEWWRDDRGQRAILEQLEIEPTTERIAKAAGVAIREVGATAVDAAVMASAALRGDLVFTSDFADLQRLQRQFPNVRVMSVSS